MKNLGVQTLLTTCSRIRPGEKILLVFDSTSREIARLLYEAALHCDSYSCRSIQMTDRAMHGEEPPAEVAQAMRDADVIFGVTRFSLFHTDARRNATQQGARFVNMADYSLTMLQQGGLFADFEAQGHRMDLFSMQLEGKSVQITTRRGTDLSAPILGRSAVRQWGCCQNPGQACSPPDIETAISPLEGLAQGLVVIDGSIPFPGIGILGEDIQLTLSRGRITAIVSDGPRSQQLREILLSLGDDAVYQLAEIGIGFNDRSALCGRMLEDEGVLGTAHLGFGSNLSFGGKIRSPYHLDMVFWHPTVCVDGRRIMTDGIPEGC